MFECKTAKMLLGDNRLMFNGATIQRSGSAISITQAKQIEKLYKISEIVTDRYEFISYSASGLYVASVCRPDLTLGF